MCADFTTFERGVAAFDLRRSWLAKAKANLKKTRLVDVNKTPNVGKCLPCFHK